MTQLRDNRGRFIKEPRIIEPEPEKIPVWNWALTTIILGVLGYVTGRYL